MIRYSIAWYGTIRTIPTIRRICNSRTGLTFVVPEHGIYLGFSHSRTCFVPVSGVILSIRLLFTVKETSGTYIHLIKVESSLGIFGALKDTKSFRIHPWDEKLFHNPSLDSVFFSDSPYLFHPRPGHK